MNKAISLEYTVPFLKDHDLHGKTLLIDKIEVLSCGTLNKDIFNLLSSKINISELGYSVPTEIAIELIEGQYNICLNYIFSHKIWSSLREGCGEDVLLSYIIENRHYLFAATSRMSSGSAYSAQIKPYTFILSDHLLEEEGHNIFFERALDVLGVKKEVIAITRPSPKTLEWIQLMRSLGARHPFVSAVCSGLMESSAKDREAVKGWHQMLINSGIIDEKAIESFYAHVELDIELGHGGCWRSVLENSSRINTELLSECLNSISLVAEQLYRWFGSLDSGLSSSFVKAAKRIQINREESNLTHRLDPMFDGSPVHSSKILELVSYGKYELSESVSQVVSLSYFLSPSMYNYEMDEGCQIVSESKNLSHLTSELVFSPSKELKLKEQILSWMKSIEGHTLWKSMLDNPHYDLIGGYILENYYYLRSSVSHSMSAISSCTNFNVRTMLVKHLREEKDHCTILGDSLSKSGINYGTLRPLSTTVSLLGFLKELAITDWMAYSIALSFLQLSIETDSQKHSNFYAEMKNVNSNIAELIDAMKRHDAIDEDLKHVNDIEALLNELEEQGISLSSLSRASLVCTHVWSFLDGIDKYYSSANSLCSRIGWNAGTGVWN